MTRGATYLRGAVVVGVAALLGSAATVHSQPTGTRIGTSIPRTKPELVFNAMAQCYVARFPKTTAEFLAAVPGSYEQSQAYAKMEGALGVCLNQPKLVFEGGELQVETDRLHRGLAFYMLRAQAEKLPATAPAAQDDRPWFRTKIEEGSSYNGFAIGVEKFGRCVAIADWTQSRALVLAQPGSKDEANALKQLRPVMDNCLTQGARINIDRRLVQHVIGDAMYHLGIAPHFENPTEGSTQ